MKRNTKAFTIVELVIVIAVIAVLAAVMIPTFSGLIKSANKSADEAEIVALNTQLATNEVKNVEDLYALIAETYGKDAADSFAPRSAKYGYHYWYDVAENMVVLKTYSEMADDAAKRGFILETTVINPRMSSAFLAAEPSAFSLSRLSAPVDAAIPAPASSEKQTTKFNKDSYRMFCENYFILDNGGSVVGEALKALDTINNDADTEFDDKLPEKLNALEEKNLPVLTSGDLKEMAGKLLEKVETIAIVSDEMTYVHDADKVTTIYFTSNIRTISDNIVGDTEKDYIAKAGNIKDPIEIPSTVTKIVENSLHFDVEVTVKLEFNGTAENAADVFQASSTNATIIISGIEGGCTINGADIINGDGVSVIDGKLTYGNQVTSFVLVPGWKENASGFAYDKASDTLYVAHNAGSFKINPSDFESTGNTDKVEKTVEWVLPTGFIMDSDGNITIPEVPDKYEESNASAYEATITAKSVTSEEAIAELNVCIVTTASATIKLGETKLLLNNGERLNTLELTYDGTPETAEYAITDFVSATNFPDSKLVCCADATPVFTTEGDLFEFVYVDGQAKLKLKTDNPYLTGTQTFKVTVGDHIEKEFTVTVQDNSLTVFEKKLSNGYLYRVGNKNSIKLGQLFSVPEDKRPGIDIEVVVYDASIGDAKPIDELKNNHLNATYPKSGLTAANWQNGEIKFTGTGIAQIKIKNNMGYQTIVVEVVDGYNITDGTQLKTNANNVLLNDVDLTAKFSLTGDANNHKVLYGNGFTLDITGAPTTGNSIITLSNADLDNVSIVGQVYTTYQDTEGQGTKEWYASAVRVANGSSRITNSYIFGCRANLKVEGNVEIVDSVLECARLANVDVISGTLTIGGLTTINEPTASNNNVVGLGIMINTGAVAGTEIKVKGELTQYNWVRESDESNLPKMEILGINVMETLVDKIFQQTKYLHTVDGVQYANMGIACLNGDIATSAVSFKEPYGANYEATTLSLAGKSGFVVSLADAKYDATTADLIYREKAHVWTPSAQANTIPTITWNKYNGGKTDVTFVKGESFEFDPNGVLSATKHGNTLTPTVTFNDVDYTGKKITFTEDGKYTIKYTISDSDVYDSNGNRIAEETYEYYLVVNVITTNPAQKAPEFSFTGATGFTTVEHNGKTYVVPTGNTSDTSKFYHIGNGIYAPIVTIEIKDNTSDFTGYYPIFGGISITWYDEANNATTYNSSSNLSAMPAGLEWITNITNLKGSTNWEGYKKYSSFGLCRQSEADGSTNETDTYKNVEFSFEVEGVGKYYYYIRYKEPAHTCPSGCVTADTLVTLADGTQKEIQYVTNEDMLLTWNHFTGEYQAVPSAIIFNHGYANNTVIKLNFSDGTQVKAINLHQFLDVDLNKYVTINSDTVADYVGHSFAKQNGDGYTTVTLESYEISEEYIEAYGIISALNYNILVEGMLSTDFMEQDYDLFNYFELGEDLVYDAEQMQKDIEEYGLYTYEEFADYLTYEQFVGFNVQYFKIAVGKGYYTYEGILELIGEYLNP